MAEAHLVAVGVPLWEAGAEEHLSAGALAWAKVFVGEYDGRQPKGNGRVYGRTQHEGERHCCQQLILTVMSESCSWVAA